MKPALLFSMMGHRGAPEVATALLDRADVELIAMEPTATLLAEEGIPCRPFAAYVDDDIEETVRPDAESRLESIRRITNSTAFRQQYPFFSDDEWGLLQRRFYGVFKWELLNSMITAEAFARCADANDLRLVVTSEDVLPATRTLLTLGARLGIPSLQVCHGVPSGTTTTHPGHTSTYLAAFSDYVKSLYRILAIPEDRIFVTGNPAWDRLAGPPRPGFRTEACAKLGLDPQQPVVVYALTHRDAWSTSTAGHTRLHLDHAEAVIKAFADLAKRHADWQFVLRPRPGSDSEAFVETVVAEMARTGLARFAVDTLRPYASVVMADVFLTTESNMGIEALLQGKPVVNVNLRELWGDALAMGFGPVFADSKAVIHVDKAEDIAPAVESALLDDSTKTALQKARRAERERFNACNDGRAAQRVADLIVRLLHNNASRPWTASPGRYAAERSQRREQAQTLNRRGEQCFAHGDLDSALQHFSEALSTWREDAVIFNNMGTVLYALKDPVSAWRSFVQALHRDPNLQSARDNLRRVADDLKQEDEADRLLDTFGTDQQPSDE